MKLPHRKYSFFLKIPLVIVLVGWINIAQAGLSGTYTIDPAKSSSSSNYQSFTSAISDLTSKGVSGPVVFNVANGVYKESLNMIGFIGSSASNTVTFQSISGDSSKVIIQPLSTSYGALYLDVCKNLIFKNITFYQINTGIVCIRLINTSNVTLTGCQIIKNSNDANLISDNNYNSNFSSNNNYIGNYLSGGNFAINFQGNYQIFSSGLIMSNQIRKCLSGIYITYSSITIRNNTVELDPNSISTTNYGLNLSQVYGHVEITGNKIIVNPGQIALYMNGCSDTGSSYSIVANNMLSGYLSCYYCDKYSFYFNNILVAGLNNTSLPSVNFTSFNAYPVVKTNFYNNCVANMNGGPAIAFNPSKITLNADYNNYYTNGTVLAQAGSSNYDKLLYWSIDNEIDANSISVYPGYYSNTDLHEKNYLLYHTGLPVAGISTDVDGETRNSKNPCIGADEFNLIGYDLAVSQIIGINSGFNCGDSASPTVVVHNVGYNNVNKVPVTLVLNNGSTVLRDTIPFISAGGSGNFSIRSILNTIDGGDFTVKAYITFPNDANKSDDTITVSGFFIPSASKPITSNITLCHPTLYQNNTILTAHKKYSTDVLTWLDAYGNFFGTGDSIQLTYIDTSTYFYVQATRYFKYGGGLKDTANGRGRFSTKPLGLIIHPQMDMILDSVTVFPKNSGSFYIGNTKYNVTVTKQGQPIKIKVNYSLSGGQDNYIYVDTVLTGGLYASYNGPPAIPISNTLISVSQQSNDSLYRYLYDMKFSAISPCPSPKALINVKVSNIQVALLKPSNFNGNYKSGTSGDPDMICGTSVSYNLATNFNDSTYGKLWEISYLSTWDQDHTSSYPASFFAPSKNSPGIVNFTAPAGNSVTNYFIQIRIKNLITGCDTVLNRYFYLNVPGAKILSTGPMCTGEVDFTEQTSNAESFLWDFGDSTNSTDQDPIHVYMLPKNGKRIFNVTLKITNSSGCSSSDSTHYVIYPKLSAGFTFLMDSINGKITLKADDTSGTGFLWTFGDSKSASGSLATHIYSTEGVYTVKLLISNAIGCTDTLSMRIKVVKESAVETYKSDPFQINIFPNPTSNNISLTYTLSKESSVKIQLLDIQGRSILPLQSSVIQPGGKIERNFILPDNITSGTYFLNLTIDGQDIVKELVVVR